MNAIIYKLIQRIEEIENKEKAKYPVGKLEFNTSGANPATYIGFGTWTLWGSGKVPICVDVNDTDFNKAEKTGGSKTHTLTVDETPKHSHTLASGYEFLGLKIVDGVSGKLPFGLSSDNSRIGWGTNDEDWSKLYCNPKTESAGNGKAHSIVQPYITCYIWKRTA